VTERTARLAIAGLGALTIVAWFLPFLDVGFAVASGWDITTAPGVDWTIRFAFVALPLLGAALIVAGLARARAARLIAFGFGASVLGYIAVQLVRIFIATTGWGLWLTIACALGALAVAFFARKARVTAKR
jgi:hypothetical protein